ncbi:FAD-dependent monooxygenase [Halobacillus salinarum]|uniref:FAD-dependent monooxygenase n=1 Tax=Halobacillus salinarum TaxID=2932257 RepID=A0ABY4EW80_9BACI|nr:FAD-dependent monooxygenase [Halobacillus salinarum]UOQ46421.1 FAD-dependent monooxygenase [Halobacillus salinarum]
MEANTDVLIVGAGPSGLMLANQLRKYGVRFQIIEQREEPSAFSKALVVHSRTLEMMDLLGISQKFIEEGFINKQIHFSYHQEKMFAVDFSNLKEHTNFPFMSIIPQSETERILEEQLPDGAVERGVELVSLTQHGETVSAVVNQGAEEHTITSKYLVACDGAHSTTRHLLDIPFEGESEGVNVILGDVKVDDPSLNSRLSLNSSDNGLLFSAPFSNGLTRVIAIDYERQGEYPESPRLKDLQESVSRVYPEELILTDPYWVSSFTASHRQIPYYRKQRVFFVGDAAHIHNPIGGQGMNIGIQDAVNLSWKLAYVLNYGLSQALLDTYHEERFPIGEGVIKKTEFMIKAMNIKNKYGVKSRNLLMKWLLDKQVLQSKITENISQLGMNYTFTHHSKQIDHKRTVGKLASGERVPNVHMLTQDKEEVHLYERLKGGQCLLLICTTEEQLPMVYETINQSTASFTSRLGGMLQPIFIIQNDLFSKGKWGLNVWMDLKGESRTRLGLAENELMVVRPDGYVLVHTDLRNPLKLKNALTQYFQ